MLLVGIGGDISIKAFSLVLSELIRKIKIILQFTSDSISKHAFVTRNIISIPYLMDPPISIKKEWTENYPSRNPVAYAIGSVLIIKSLQNSTKSHPLHTSLLHTADTIHQHKHALALILDTGSTPNASRRLLALLLLYCARAFRYMPPVHHNMRFDLHNFLHTRARTGFLETN